MAEKNEDNPEQRDEEMEIVQDQDQDQNQSQMTLQDLLFPNTVQEWTNECFNFLQQIPVGPLHNTMSNLVALVVILYHATQTAQPAQPEDEAMHIESPKPSAKKPKEKQD